MSYDDIDDQFQQKLDEEEKQEYLLAMLLHLEVKYGVEREIVEELATGLGLKEWLHQPLEH